MLVAELIASALVDAEFPNVFPKNAPSALDYPEAIVLLQGPFEREGRMAGEERGTMRIRILVVRDLPAEAEDAALSVEKCIRRSDWELHRDADPWRIAGIDTSAPFFKERDSSGRYVWEIDVDVTAVREI